MYCAINVCACGGDEENLCYCKSIDMIGNRKLNESISKKKDGLWGGLFFNNRLFLTLKRTKTLKGRNSSASSSKISATPGYPFWKYPKRLYVNEIVKTFVAFFFNDFDEHKGK